MMMMMMRVRALIAVAGLLLASAGRAGAQAPPTNPPAQTPPPAATVPAPRAQAPATARPAAAPVAARASIALMVTDVSGTAIPDVHVIMAGPVPVSYTHLRAHETRHE